MVAEAFGGAAVVVEFGAGAGGAFESGGAPPVVAVAVAVDAFRGYADVVAPEVVGFVVVQVDGYIHSCGGEAELAGAELPGEGHGVGFEVVADAEVAQHFEEGEVFVVADFVDVGGAEGFLAAGEAAAGWRLLAHKEGFEGYHAGGGEEEGGVAGGDEGGGGHSLVSPFLEEVAEGIADAVAVHRGCDSVARCGAVLRVGSRVAGLCRVD